MLLAHYSLKKPVMRLLLVSKLKNQNNSRVILHVSILVLILLAKMVAKGRIV